MMEFCTIKKKKYSLDLFIATWLGPPKDPVTCKKVKNRVRYIISKNKK